jgi:carboxylate-amine ligase
MSAIATRTRISGCRPSLLIFGLHIHIGIESHELAVELMNQLRTWLPHVLAISSNSPCWAGRLTGLKSYRSVVWKPFPRSGVPEVFPSSCDFDAYVQALVAKLTWLYQRGLRTPALSSHFIEENKWRAMHDGLDADVIDFVQDRRLSMRESISDLLDFVDGVIDDLGSRHEIDYLRRLLEDPRGTGADRQIALYEQTGSVEALIQLLMQQTMQGIPVKVPA